MAVLAATATPLIGSIAAALGTGVAIVLFAVVLLAWYLQTHFKDR